jgi:hypothetical protein
MRRRRRTGVVEVGLMVVNGDEALTRQGKNRRVDLF